MSLVSQTLAQLSDLKTLEQEIVDVLTASDVALSSKQIGERIPNPPDGETLSREIYRMKKEGQIEHDPLATPPPKSRGNVGMYRIIKAGQPPTPKQVSEPSFTEALMALRSAAKDMAPACVQQNRESDTQPALTTTNDTQIDLAPGEEERLLPGGELSVPSKAQVSSLEAMIKGLPQIVEDIVLDDPDTVEFAVYSSGGLDIYCEDCAITLHKPVLAKLRYFLGLFREESA